MIILTIRTDKPEAEVGLYTDETQIAYKTWLAHRQLAETIHETIDMLCVEQGYAVSQIEGIVFYKGPGSFTGLRIGGAVTNALAYSLGVPVVGTDSDDWQASGIKKLLAGDHDALALPVYDSPAITTQQKK